MSTTKEKIAIMQAFIDGAKIECMDKDDPAKQFNYVGTPAWNWNEFDYRVMQERTLEQKIKDKWPDKEVVMLKYDNSNVLCMECDAECGSDHIVAQSMRGFHTYVYQRPQDDSFFPDTKAVYCWNEFITLQPVAVLFEAQK